MAYDPCDMACDPCDMACDPCDMACDSYDMDRTLDNKHSDDDALFVSPLKVFVNNETK
jgi:hypothetical protein